VLNDYRPTDPPIGFCLSTHLLPLIAYSLVLFLAA